MIPALACCALAMAAPPEVPGTLGSMIPGPSLASQQGTSVPRGFQQWDQGKLYTAKGPISSIRELTITTPKGVKERIRIPEDHRLIAVMDGAVYVYHRASSGGRVLKRSLDHGKTWEAAVSWTPAQKGLPGALEIMPLENGKWFLAAGLLSVLRHESEPAFFAIGVTLPDGTLGIESILDPGLGPLWRTDAKLQSSAFAQALCRPEAQPLIQDLMIPRIQAADHALAVLMPMLGQILVFDRRTRRHRRNIALFPEIDDKKYKALPKSAAILGARPMPDGRLLVASRSLDAVLYSRSMLHQGDESPLPGESRAQHADRLQKSWDTRFSAFGDLRYWEVDLQEGKPVPRQPSAGLPSRLEAPHLLKGFNFYTDGRGQVECVIEAQPGSPR